MDSSCNNVLGSREEFDQVCSQIRRDVDFDSMFNSILLLEIRDSVLVKERLGSLGYDAMIGHLTMIIESHLDEDKIASYYDDGLFIVALHNVKSYEDVTSFAKAVTGDFDREYAAENIGLIAAASTCDHNPKNGYRCAFDKAFEALEELRGSDSRFRYVGESKEDMTWQLSTASQN
ncbi:hypothetical protein SAMN02910456_02298 [Ruminococcaceae bacterium YRB3002]|nr:hypothetical protein SAMN02910456_02298 [Ruminococcaceae bacterium YRB3002]